MMIELTKNELIVIRDALREWRTVPPAHIANNEGKLNRWREYRDLFEDDRNSSYNKISYFISCS